jgi:hypothetical protein
MTPTPITISSKRSETTTSEQPIRKTGPVSALVITTVDALTVDNQRGCGNDNPYN